MPTHPFFRQNKLGGGNSINLTPLLLFHPNFSKSVPPDDKEALPRLKPRHRRAWTSGHILWTKTAAERPPPATMLFIFNPLLPTFPPTDVRKIMIWTFRHSKLNLHATARPKTHRLREYFVFRKQTRTFFRVLSISRTAAREAGGDSNTTELYSTLVAKNESFHGGAGMRPHPISHAAVVSVYRSKYIPVLWAVAYKYIRSTKYGTLTLKS